MEGITLGRSGRRGFLMAAGAGTAAAVALPVAAAATPQATTTTAPPKRPVGDDTALLGFARTVELAAVEAYDAVLAQATALKVTEGEALVVKAFRQHHFSYAESLGALIGPGAPTAADPAIAASLKSAVSGTDKAKVMKAVADFEDVAVATHGSLVAVLNGTDGAALVASIMVIEARHATTLNALLGTTDVPANGLEDLSAALSPDPQ